jgi:hypothetical protein
MSTVVSQKDFTARSLRRGRTCSPGAPAIEMFDRLDEFRFTFTLTGGGNLAH